MIKQYKYNNIITHFYFKKGHDELMEEENLKEQSHFCDSVAHEVIKTAIYIRIKGSQCFNQLSDVGVTFEQYIALDAISHNPNICQRDLSKLILKDRSNTGRILNILEEKKYIQRIAETKNNRLVKTLQITQEGQNLLDKNNSKIRKKFSNVLNGMTEKEFETLNNLLRKFRTIVSEDTNIQI